jgi:L-ribulose-5-phosphate 3-epimerase
VGSIGERPDEIDRVLDASGSRYVKLVLDVAHYFQGGGDPAKAIERCRDRLLYLHVKDVERPAPGSSNANSFEFVELGRGQVNLPAVFEALQKARFRGWAVVELDNGSAEPHSPKESAVLNNKFIEEKLGIRQMKSPFRVSVITDEITQDVGRALEAASGEFGLGWVELRGLWNRNIMKLDAREIAEARRLLERYRLRVTDIASPLFKAFWPRVLESVLSAKQPDQFGADFTFDQQDEVLERALELCRVFKTNRLRIFDFWRLKDPSPYRAAMDAKLLEAAHKGARKSALLLENESACNTATGAEAARTLNAVRAPNFLLNWDPANAAVLHDTPHPDGYSHLPKERIGHVHCKDLVRKPDGKGYEWMPMGAGNCGLGRAIPGTQRDSYRFGVSLETHRRGTGTAEASTRQSMADMQKLLRAAGAWS